MSASRAPAPQVRRFRQGDWDEWLRMSMSLFPHTGPEDHEGDMRPFIERDDAAVFIAERPDGTVCGYVEVGTRPYVDGCDSSPVGYIEAWWVDEDVRRTGYGRALLTAAEDWARSQGYTEMGSDALLDNTLSHQAHRASGYEEVDRVVQFRKRLR